MHPNIISRKRKTTKRKTKKRKTTKKKTTKKKKTITTKTKKHQKKIYLNISYPEQLWNEGFDDIIEKIVVGIPSPGTGFNLGLRIRDYDFISSPLKISKVIPKLVAKLHKNYKITLGGDFSSHVEIFIKKK